MPKLVEQHPAYAGSLLTLDEAAHALGMSRRTAERSIARGDFPVAPVQLGRRRRWRRADIERWLNGEEVA